MEGMLNYYFFCFLSKVILPELCSTDVLIQVKACALARLDVQVSPPLHLSLSLQPFMLAWATSLYFTDTTRFKWRLGTISCRIRSVRNCNKRCALYRSLIYMYYVYMYSGRISVTSWYNRSSLWCVKCFFFTFCYSSCVCKFHLSFPLLGILPLDTECPGCAEYCVVPEFCLSMSSLASKQLWLAISFFL